MLIVYKSLLGFSSDLSRQYKSEWTPTRRIAATLRATSRLEVICNVLASRVDRTDAIGRRPFTLCLSRRAPLLLITPWTRGALGLISVGTLLLLRLLPIYLLEHNRSYTPAAIFTSRKNSVSLIRLHAQHTYTQLFLGIIEFTRAFSKHRSRRFRTYTRSIKIPARQTT